MNARTISTLLAATLLCCAAPATADAAKFKDRGNGYGLSIDFRKGEDHVVLTLPRSDPGAGNQYFVYCGRSFKRQGPLVLGALSFDETRRFENDTRDASPKRRKCELLLNDDREPTARFTLVRA